MSIVIFHNPNCSKSRATLELLHARGKHPVVIDYLDAGWTRAHLLTLLAVAGISVRDVLRESEATAQELGLASPETSDETILDAMVQHPELVNRPIVCTAKGVSLCRPVERVLDLL